MDQPEFERMVARLEAESRQAPAAYKAKVAMLALLGFGMLASVIGLACAGLVALVAVPIAVLASSHATGALFGLIKLLLVLAAPLWFLVKSSVSALLTRLPVPQGLELTREQAPALFTALDRMRLRMKGPRFHHVLVTQDFNAALVQRPLFGLFGWPRNYLILGLPLLEILSPEEALAVVAHEYGHLAGSHGHFAAFIYRLRNTWGTIQAISHHWKGAGGNLLGRLVRWYAPHFNAYTFVLARANEYEADAASAELVGASVAASALKRVDVGAAHYEQFMQRTYGQVREAAEPPADLSVRWAMLAQHAEPDQARLWLDRALAREAQVSDTHPSLRERLHALRDDSADQVPVPLSGPSAAQAWLGRQTAVLRQQMQSQWRERVIEPWKNQHADLQKRSQRLGELRSLAEPTQEQGFERLCLQLELEADADHAADLAAFNAAHAEHAGGLYLEGVWRLSKGDATGLDWLGRAMSLDASTVKPACEKAYAFLKEHGDDARAEDYAKRWSQRNDWELAVAEQRSQLNPKHELREPDLSPEEMAAVRALVQAHRSGIKRAYLARRVLPLAPDVPTYVLALELKSPFLRLATSAKIVHRMAQGGEWPAHLVVCSLEGRYRPLKKRVKGLVRARVL